MKNSPNQQGVEERGRPTRFKSNYTKDPLGQYKAAFADLGITYVEQEPDFGKNGQFDTGVIEVCFDEGVSAFVMAHELGHAIDWYPALQDGRALRARFRRKIHNEPAFKQLSKELDRVTDYTTLGFKMEGAVTWTKKRQIALLRRYPMLRRKPKTLYRILKFRWDVMHYHRSADEQFADLFALCLTEPKRARRLAPNATRFLLEELYFYPFIRGLMYDHGWWE